MKRRTQIANSDPRKSRENKFSIKDGKKKLRKMLEKLISLHNEFFMKQQMF